MARRQWTGFIVAIALLTACTPNITSIPDAAPTGTAVVTASPAPTATAQPTATVTPIPPTPTATTVPLSEMEREAFTQAYRYMVFVEMDARLLLEYAQRIQNQSITGFQAMGSFIGIGAIFKAVDEAVTAFAAPEPLDLYWTSILRGHTQSRDIFARWADEQITSTDVIAEIEPVIADLSSTAAAVESLLGARYGFDSGELTEARAEIMDRIPAFFETPTPTATP